MGIALKGEKLTKYYKDTQNAVINNLDFSWDTGGTYGVIGKNGSGKSTFLKLISGIIKPSSGKVSVYGKLSSLIDLGQGLERSLTGRQNCELLLKLQKINKEESQSIISRIYEFTELGKKFDVPVKEYSSGMVLRLGFASIVETPFEILVLDEVISVGDNNFMKKCFEKLAEFIKLGKTIIIASHDLDLISAYTSQTLLFQNGKSFLGYTSTLIDLYRKDEEIDENVQFAILEHKEIQLINCFFNNKEIAFNQNLDVKLVFYSHERFSGGITISIFSERKRSVLSTATVYSKNKVSVDFYHSEVTFIETQLQLEGLSPGNYFADVSIHNNEHIEIKVFKNAFEFEIVDRNDVFHSIKNNFPPFVLLPTSIWDIKLISGSKKYSILNNRFLEIELLKKGWVGLPKLDTSVQQKLTTFFAEEYPLIRSGQPNVITINEENLKKRCTINQKIIELLAEYLNENFKNYKVVLATYFCKSCGAQSFVGYHADPTFSDPTIYDDFTLWIPLFNSQEKIGELEVLEFSHLQTNKINFYSYTPPYLAMANSMIGKKLEVNCGEPILFYNRLLHRSEANHHADIRLAVSVKLIEKSAPMYSYFISEMEGYVDRYFQNDQFYLEQQWNEFKKPDSNKFDRTIKIE